ncbi:MAG: hypothetical protein WB502_15350 [Thermoactinomyces sp.]
MYQTASEVKMIEEKAKKEQDEEKKAQRVVQEATKTRKHEKK